MYSSAGFSTLISVSIQLYIVTGESFIQVQSTLWTFFAAERLDPRQRSDSVHLYFSTVAAWQKPRESILVFVAFQNFPGGNLCMSFIYKNDICTKKKNYIYCYTPNLGDLDLFRYQIKRFKITS